MFTHTSSPYLVFFPKNKFHLWDAFCEGDPCLHVLSFDKTHIYHQQGPSVMQHHWIPDVHLWRTETTKFIQKVNALKHFRFSNTGNFFFSGLMQMTQYCTLKMWICVLCELLCVELLTFLFVHVLRRCKHTQESREEPGDTLN